MDLNGFILLIVACLAVNLSPGPSILLVSSVSAAGGFRAGLFAVLGMTAGAFVHVVLAARCPGFYPVLVSANIWCKPRIPFGDSGNHNALIDDRRPLH